MNIPIKPIIKGFVSYTPLKAIVVRKGTGGTNSARYCYSVWLRHLVLLYQNGIKMHPKIVAELGPGDSLGVGLAALITGAEKYYALDVVRHTDLNSNIKIFEELVNLFKMKSPIPDENEFPEIKPQINSYTFPEYLFNKNYLDEFKLEEIKRDLQMGGGNFIQYIVPWYAEEELKIETIDLIFSQAVMEHIIDLDSAYKSMYKYLKKGGYISHQIDYRAHETHKIWNGHWKYNNLLWKIIMHGRSYPINREPHSEHIKKIVNAGFTIVNTLKVERHDGYKSSDLPLKYAHLNQDDLVTASSHIIGKK